MFADLKFWFKLKFPVANCRLSIQCSTVAGERDKFYSIESKSKFYGYLFRTKYVPHHILSPIN